MAGFDGGINLPNPASTVAASIPRPLAKAAPEVSPERDATTNTNADAQSSAGVLSKTASTRKLESLQQTEQNFSELRAAAAKLDEEVKTKAINLSFSVDEASKRFVVEIKDSKTGELIRVVPGEAVLRTAASLESLKGVLFDDVY